MPEKLTEIMKLPVYVQAPREEKLQFLKEYHRRTRGKHEKLATEAAKFPQTKAGIAASLVDPRQIATGVGKLISEIPSMAKEMYTVATEKIPEQEKLPITLPYGMQRGAHIAKKLVVDPGVETQKRLLEKRKTGEIGTPEMLANMAVGAVPLAGPMAVGMAEEAGKSGRLGEITGQVTGLVYGPKAIGPPTKAVARPVGALGKAAIKLVSPLKRPVALQRVERALSSDPKVVVKLTPKGQKPGTGRPIAEVPRLESAVPEISAAETRLGLNISKGGLEEFIMSTEAALDRTGKILGQHLEPFLKESLVGPRTVSTTSGYTIQSVNALEDLMSMYKRLPKESTMLTRVEKALTANKPLTVADALSFSELLGAHVDWLRYIKASPPKMQLFRQARGEIRTAIYDAIDKRIPSSQIKEAMKTWGNLKEVLADSKSRFAEYASESSLPLLARLSPFDAYHTARALTGSQLHGAIAIIRHASPRGFAKSDAFIRSAWPALRGQQSNLNFLIGGRGLKELGAGPTPPVGPQIGPTGPLVTPAPGTAPVPPAPKQLGPGPSPQVQPPTPKAAGVAPAPSAPAAPAVTSIPSKAAVDQYVIRKDHHNMWSVRQNDYPAYKVEPRRFFKRKTDVEKHLKELRRQVELPAKPAPAAPAAAPVKPTSAAPTTVTVYRGGVPDKPGMWFTESRPYAEQYVGHGRQLSKTEIKPKNPLNLDNVSDAGIVAKALEKATGQKVNVAELRQGIAEVPKAAADELIKLGYDFITVKELVGEFMPTGRVWVSLKAMKPGTKLKAGPALADWEEAVKVNIRGEGGKAGARSAGYKDALRQMIRIRRGEASLEAVPESLRAEVMSGKILTPSERRAFRAAEARKTGKAPTKVSLKAPGVAREAKLTPSVLDDLIQEEFTRINALLEAGEITVEQAGGLMIKAGSKTAERLIKEKKIRGQKR